MSKSSNKLTADQLGRLIYEVRGERVMLDSDLASIYGVETKALNRAVKRNRDRFPKDFVFQLSQDDWKNLRYQIGTSSSDSKRQSLRYQIGTASLRHGGRRSRPYAFTEHGAIMAANILNSRRAVQMSVFVVRAFLKMRALLGDKRDLAQKTSRIGKGTEEATRCPRGRYRHNFTTSHGYHRSSGPASSAAQAANCF